MVFRISIVNLWMHPYITDEDENIITNQLYLSDHRNSRHYYVFLCLFKRQSTEFNVFGIRNINYLQHGAGIGFVSLKSCRINCIKYLFGVCGSWYWGLVLRKNTKGDPGIVGGRVMCRSPVSSHFQLWSFVAVSGFPFRVLQVLDVFLGSNSVTKRSCGVVECTWHIFWSSETKWIKMAHISCGYISLLWSHVFPEISWGELPKSTSNQACSSGAQNDHRSSMVTATFLSYICINMHQAHINPYQSNDTYKEQENGWKKNTSIHISLLHAKLGSSTKCIEVLCRWNHRIKPPWNHLQGAQTWWWTTPLDGHLTLKGELAKDSWAESHSIML